MDERDTCDSCNQELANYSIKNSNGTFCSLFCEDIEKKCKNIIDNSKLMGLSYGIRESSENFADNVILNASKGHGFAAEKANHIKDVFSGKDAKIIGGDNKLNGADRLVDGIQIQTKYCKSGSKCISECFDETGKFRYINPDGSPMQIEVPLDKYDSAIQSMEDKIRKGKIPGVSDPSKAKDIVRKGHFTYEQVRNIAKVGTIESLSYDAVNGIKLAGTALGISSVLTFAVSMWRGESFEVSLKNACISGLKVGGISWVSSILSAQIGRTGIESSLRSFTDFVVQKMGAKAASVIANSMRNATSPIYGAAAMNNVSKLLRGNIVTGVITTAVLSSVDVFRLIDGRISGSQAFKNIANTASSVAGGTGGWMAGAAAGAAMGSAIPIIGNIAGGIIGGLAGSLLGGTLANTASNAILDEFIEDDAKSMSKILEKTLQGLVLDFIMTEPEINFVINEIEKINFGHELREMYASNNRVAYATNLVKPIIIKKVTERKFIKLPDENLVLDEIRELIESE